MSVASRQARQGGYTQGGYTQGGYTQGGYTQGGYTPKAPSEILRQVQPRTNK